MPDVLGCGPSTDKSRIAPRRPPGGNGIPHEKNGDSRPSFNDFQRSAEGGGNENLRTVQRGDRGNGSDGYPQQLRQRYHERKKGDTGNDEIFHDPLLPGGDDHPQIEVDRDE